MMTRRNLFLYAIFSMFFIAQPVLAEGPSNSVRTMATIINYLNHFPGDSEKAKLSKIVDGSDSSDAEKVIATALLNLQHGASSGDKKKLSMVMADGSAPQAVRDLAKIVHDLNHKASDADKAILKKYMW